MDNQPETPTPSKRTFQWEVTSSDIAFMRPRPTEGARDGSNCNDCSSYVSPLPRPKRAPVGPAQEQK